MRFVLLFAKICIRYSDPCRTIPYVISKNFEWESKLHEQIKPSFVSVFGILHLAEYPHE